ncbi:hypothetical protein BSLG_007662 [Batrachochytrium salamandrivorans]|nr:hypothetical protein BASA60_003653 [Batrachochytrium salamandrivorans]KAJ1334507.1 hypothetical protein BSLG_007662 [Batrachochytrium salamandrivorans]
MKVSTIVYGLLAIASQAPAAFALVRTRIPFAESIDPRIKNVVVLVMENRSFDSVFGRLKWDKINTKVDGLTGNESNILANGQVVKVSKATNPAAGFDPNHEIAPVTEQIYGAGIINTAGKTPSMSGFAQQAFVESKGNMDSVQQVMQAFGSDTLPVTYALAKEFTIIDNWFASVPGPTYPNRHFYHCATASGYTSNTGNFLGIPCRTIYDNMDDAGVSFRFYSSQLKASPLLYRSLRTIPHLIKIKQIEEFYEDARDGTLRQYSFIDPDFSLNDNHPPHNLHAGEQYVKDIYEALRASPQWNQTMFIITYDENGGFYDHVVPPTDVPIPDASVVGTGVGDFKFDRLGPRVPTIVISPYVPKGGVIHSKTNGRYFEHSSIPATLKKLFKMPKFLTKRDAWALTFESVASLATIRTDCIETLPNA